MAEIKLHKWAATALLGEARHWFDNAAREFLAGDENQRPTLDAYTEIIGRLADPVACWPQEDHHFDEGFSVKQDRDFIEVGFTKATLDRIEHFRDQQQDYVTDLDRGEWMTRDLGDMEREVYLLHVLNEVVKQRETVAA